MIEKNKNKIIFKRLLIWALYLFTGYILYSKKGNLYPFLITFTKFFYPLSIFWLQIRIKKRDRFLPIDAQMTTSQLWFNILPVIACLFTVIFSLANSLIYCLNLLSIL